MNANNTSTELNEQPLMIIMQRLRDRTLDPNTIGKDLRQQCVEVCFFEGHTLHQIAQLFCCSAKTIQRDLAAIRERNALAPSDDLAKQLMGEIFQKIMNHHDYLLRFTRNKDVKATEKIGAIAVACKTLIDLAELLRSAGYLPSAPLKVSHEVQIDQDRTWDQIGSELVQLREIANKTSVLTPDLENDIRDLEEKVRKSSVQEGINQIISTNKLNKEDGNYE